MTLMTTTMWTLQQ